MKKKPTTRVAIYARVPTTNKGHAPENQLRKLRDWLHTQGYKIAGE